MMSPWPAIAFIALLLALAFLAWARIKEGPSPEFAQYGPSQKIQTIALIYAGAFVLTAAGWGLVLLLIDFY